MGGQYMSNPFANPYANPYQPPKDLGSDVVLESVPTELEFQRSISYVFDNPNWPMNLLAIVLCHLAGNIIPVLPAMVLLGYQFVIVEALLARPHDTYPDFKFDRLTEYLMRGLYPLLVALIGGILAIPFLLIAIGIPVGLSVLAIANVDEDVRTVLLFILIPIGVVYLFVIIFLMNLAIVPMVLRAGLAQDIGSAFNFSFIKDFASRMWRDMLYAGVFLMCAALVAELLGVMLFCVGIFFTIAVVQLAQAHLGMQLYRIYLLRGGQRVSQKATDAIVFPAAATR
jgi:hypothetical protein